MTKMRKSDILKDKNINTININNIDKDYDQIKIIGDVRESPIHNVVKTILLVILTIALCGVAFVGIYLAINDKIVQGDVDGAIYKVGEYSIVEDSYSPINYIHEGSIIYYDGSSTSFFNPSSSFTLGKVASVTDGKVYIEGDKEGKTIPINKSQIQFVVNS